MPEVGELALGQLAALGAGLLFFVIELIRFSGSVDRPLLHAALEGFRMWGLVAVAEACIWLALRTSDPGTRIAYGIISPIAGALVFNNAYLALHRYFFQPSPS